MRNGIDRGKKAGAAISAAVMTLFLVWIFVGLLIEGSGCDIVIPALVIIAVVGGIMLALRERFREIEGAEEEDAGKY